MKPCLRKLLIKHFLKPLWNYVVRIQNADFYWVADSVGPTNIQHVPWVFGACQHVLPEVIVTALAQSAVGFFRKPVNHKKDTAAHSTGFSTVNDHQRPRDMLAHAKVWWNSN
jgi:hypothetical protein